MPRAASRAPLSAASPAIMPAITARWVRPPAASTAAIAPRNRNDSSRRRARLGMRRARCEAVIARSRRVSAKRGPLTASAPVLILGDDLAGREIDHELATLLLAIGHIGVAGSEIAEGLLRTGKALAASGLDRLGIGIGCFDSDRIAPRPDARLRDVEHLERLLAGDDVGAVGAFRIFRAQNHIKSQVDAFADVLLEHHLRNAAFQNPLSHM